jgi:trans-2,3-dihydro-3-hydroxyanthranilate isomerase
MPLTLNYALLDVFAARPFEGNSLTVFALQHPIDAAQMQAVTREMRQFESIFLTQGAQPTHFHARIFTMEEELGFAGHPILGAAVAMHRAHFSERDIVELHFATPEKTLPVTSRRIEGNWFAEMDQGEATIAAPLADSARPAWCAAFNLAPADLVDGLPLQVVSTGLPYLIVPLKQNLEHAAISVPDLEARLAAIGAKFAYLIDVHRLEGRTWDNDGRVEDAATGSAAGPVAAYLVTHGLARRGEEIIMKQGRFVHRPSELLARVESDAMRVRVSGQVVPMGGGALDLD